MTNTNRRSAKELDGMASRSNRWRLAVAEGLMFIVSRMFHDDVLVEVIDAEPSGWSCSACGFFEFTPRGAPVTCEHVMAATRQMGPESRRALSSVIAPVKPPSNPTNRPLKVVQVEATRIATMAASAGARAARAAEHDRIHQPVVSKVVTRKQTDLDRLKLQKARARKAASFETPVAMARFNN